MNDYDDSEDYSSASSFRARSNTWPLNRPDLAVPNSVCIDETLPEIELEEDELFTTNEIWSTGLVDHDIMSWDPVLNAQNQHNLQHHLPPPQPPQQQQQSQQPQQQQPQHQQQQQQHHQQQSTATIHHHHHPQQDATPTIHHDHHHQQHQQQHQQQQLIHQTLYHQPHDNSGSAIILSSSSTIHQQIPPQPDQQQHCLADDPTNEYHIQQLHHLHLDNHSQPHHQQQLHYLTSPSLDNNSHGLLSSSLSTSGFGLSGDLEDLDYKTADSSAILHDPQQQQQPNLQGQTSGSESGNGPSAINNGVGGGSMNNKQSSSSTTSSKTKLNTPRRNAWGNMSYADLISQAINSTNDKRLTLSQIYDWMVQHVPYFKDKGDSNSSAGWKNSVRHNLSLHNRFKRLQNEGTGKSSWWTINPEANIGKCARRRAASMEASKYEKKRGRAKKRADAVRQGLVSYPSLTNSSLNGSTGTLEQQPQIQSVKNQFEAQHQQTDGLNSYDVNNGQLSTGLYVATSQQSLYDEEDKLPPQQQQQQSQAPPITPPLQITSAPPPLSVQQQQPDPDCLFYCYTSHNHYIRPQANVRTDLTAD